MDLAGVCKSILDRISSYELLNNLLPGTVYTVLVDKLTTFRVLSDSPLENIVICYVAGLIISRIGSVYIEPMLKSIKGGQWLGRVPYNEYVSAERKDSDGRLRKFSMINNAYRSLAAAFMCLFITMLVHQLWALIAPSWWAEWVAFAASVLVVVLIFILMCLSYKKQTGYVVKRVKALNGEDTADACGKVGEEKLKKVEKSA